MAKSNKTVPSPESVANNIANNLDTDLIVYFGSIDRGDDFEVIELCESRRRRPKAILTLMTEGGDADPAYRIARCLQEKYNRFSVFVSGFCKSAGTIIVLGANEIIMSDHGELGPLDVQFAKRDELFGYHSGLTVAETLSTLESKAFKMFEHYMLEITEKSAGRITFKTATEIACKMVTGLLESIYGQINPMHIGEAGRAMNIAKDYGERLAIKSKNFTTQTLELLVSTYPYHGFVIDFQEASHLFKHVSKPSADLELFANLFGKKSRILTASKKLIKFYSDEVEENDKEEKTSKEATNAKSKADKKEKGSRRGDGRAPEDLRKTANSEIVNTE